MNVTILKKEIRLLLPAPFAPMRTVKSPSSSICPSELNDLKPYISMLSNDIFWLIFYNSDSEFNV